MPDPGAIHSWTIEDLLRDVEARRGALVADPPLVCLFGAGASLGSGIGAMPELMKFMVGSDDFDEFVADIRRRNEDERFRLLARFLTTEEPRCVTPGYRALAALCSEGYFDVLLTLNLDPVLDDALAEARLRRRDYLLLVNGIMRPERVGRLVHARSPRIKVLKLHGDLFQRCMAWTPEEMDGYIDEVEPYLAPALQGRDTLVVGTSLRDDGIRRMVENTGGIVWFTNPFGVSDHLAHMARLRPVVGDDCDFEQLMTTMAERFGVPYREAAPSPLAAARDPFGFEQPDDRLSDQVTSTVDDMLTATVGIAGSGAQRDEAMMTGFLLANPRVIITDGWAGNVDRLHDRDLAILTSDGRRLKVRRSHYLRDHPFGPLCLEVPDGLDGPGLDLDDSPLAPNQRVHVTVAAGNRRGLSTGAVRTALEVALSIAPLPDPVPHLVELRCAVAPGSSGAPVVDDNFAVRGFIVAGSSDLDRPVSYMYPAQAWGPRLGKL